MGFGSPIHWIVLVLVIVLLFGGGRISSLMGDVAKGIKSFKKGLADDDDDGAATRNTPAAPRQIEGTGTESQAPQANATSATENKQG